MRKEWRKYLTRNAPRYTSYPSALFFSEEIGSGDYAQALDGIGQYDPVSIYVHIPFCAQLCWYCGCNMKVENNYQRTVPYIEALRAEIAHISARLKGRGATTQVHFGGGTPNYFHADDLATILHEIELGMGLTDQVPVALELDPRLCTPEKIRAMEKIGVTRMSLGVQDFDPFVQTAINRVQSYELIHECVGIMRDAGIDDISFDLLYGLPRQRLTTFRETLRKTVSLAPDRISLFGYAHLPEKIHHQRMIEEGDLPCEGLRADLVALADEMLVEAGYERIGFDHFARPESAIAVAQRRGQLNRNFQGFTEDPALNVIGFGSSAISSVNGKLYQNAKSLKDYQKRVFSDGFAVQRGVHPTCEQAETGEWIRRFLCDGAASLEEYSRITGHILSRSEIEGRMSEFVNDGIVRLEKNRIVMNRDARMFARSVAAALDPMTAQTPSAMSKAV